MGAPEESTLTSSTTSSSLLANSAAANAKYSCVCNQGFYIPNETFQGFSSDRAESDNGNASCIPCPNNCLCDKDGKCSFDEQTEDPTETLLRATIGAILGACVLCCFVMAFVVFQQRKCKVSNVYECFMGSGFHESIN